MGPKPTPLEQLVTALRSERAQRARLIGLLRHMAAELADEEEDTDGW
ncbi:MAG: hypothetical protein QOD63_1357 [Actinomycetota bacterium]|jgi:hypothetical protein|nr:hypothetical protein [Actinomycetota bacterium]